MIKYVKKMVYDINKLLKNVYDKSKQTVNYGSNQLEIADSYVSFFNNIHSSCQFISNVIYMTLWRNNVDNNYDVLKIGNHYKIRCTFMLTIGRHIISDFLKTPNSIIIDETTFDLTPKYIVDNGNENKNEYYLKLYINVIFQCVHCKSTIEHYQDPNIPCPSQNKMVKRAIKN